jgi:hypothetical protein
MRPLPEHERLNDQLEKHLSGWYGKEQLDQSGLSSAPTIENDPQSDPLVALACHLQAAPSLQVRPDFARRLEERMLLHHVALRHQLSERVKTRGSWLFSRPFGISISYISMAVVLLCSLLGTSILALAAQATNPSSPLYTVKKWEQHVQLSLVHSPLDQAEVSLQIARDRLNALANAHGDTYRQALADLNGQINAVMQILATIPTGQDRNRLSNELDTLKASARHGLRDLLPKLSLSERLMTTDELRQLGEPVTQLNHAVIIVSSPSSTQATISLTGSNFYSGEHLLIDDVLMGDSGTLQNGTYTFTVSWNRQSSPQTIGILNTDGTVAQTTVILLPNAKSGNADKGAQNNNDKGKNTHGDNSGNMINGNKQDGNNHNGGGQNPGNNSLQGSSNGSNNHENKNR